MPCVQMSCISLRVCVTRNCRILVCLHDIWSGDKSWETFEFYDSNKRAIKDHLWSCHQCCNEVCNASSFKILRKYHINYDTKIHEALLIK